MRVLIACRTNIEEVLTGDRIIVTETAKALRREGLDVDISSNFLPEMKMYDVVHLVGTLNPYNNYIRLHKAKELGKPVVVSTIFWDWDHHELRDEQYTMFGKEDYYHILLNKLKYHMPSTLLAFSMKIINKSKNLSFQHYRKQISAERMLGLDKMRSYIYSNADVLLPNSHAEYQYLKTKYGISNDYISVCDGVEQDFEQGSALKFVSRYGIKDFVLCVALICLRKNQYRLLSAMKSISVPLVLIGTEEKKYGRLCRKIAGSNVFFLGEMERTMLKNAYAAARVHVLSSFYETPGIVSLEAALANCAIVSTDRGCTREYFRDDVCYCQPKSVESIKVAISNALKTGPSSALKTRIKREFTWLNAAKATIQGYNIALEKSKIGIH